MAKRFTIPSVTGKAKLRTRRFAALAFLLFFVIAFFACGGALFTRNGMTGGESADKQSAVTASAYSEYAFTVNEYTAEVRVNKDRTVQFHERISVTMQTSGTQFYRSLPIDSGDAYFNVSAKRSDTDGTLVSDEFSVINNPDNSDYIDIVCYDGVSYGAAWIYDFYYSMRSSETTADGMTLDVVGGGWTVPLNNVTVTVTFPSAFRYEYYSGSFGSKGHGNVTATENGNSLILTSPVLAVVYNSTYGDYSASPITLQFTLESGAMSSYVSMLLSSPVFWVTLLVSAGIAVAAFFLTSFFKVDHEMVTVVSVKPPEGMDPLMMGRIIDGKVDTEDITSMIYYFADQGYLTIELPEDKKGDPILHRTDKEIPREMPSWQRVLLEGLFDKDRRKDTEISQLQNKFYASADKAKTLISARRGAEYETKSIVGMVICAILAVGLYELMPFFVGRARIGGGYSYLNGLFSAVPIALCCAGFFMVEQRRYKDKASLRRWEKIGLTVLLALFGVWYTFAFARHILTVYEKLFISIGATLCAVIAPRCVSRTEKYVQTLGSILGFKDFILYTEEDKIKFMLEENPQLYYDILPYAQVLGVSNEWENKFKSIVIEPPKWCTGNVSFSVFDYMILNSMLRASFRSAMVRPQPKGGTFLGGGGGGGHFGGFSGGGHGGGGGGVR